MTASHKTKTYRPGPPPRFTRRVVLFEEPEVVERLETLARGWGHSLAAEVREALRFWLAERAREE